MAAPGESRAAAPVEPNAPPGLSRATLRMAFYNVGIVTPQFLGKHFNHHMSRLLQDLHRVLAQIPGLGLLHLCEFGGHGDDVPDAVRVRLQDAFPSWTILFQNNYVLLWRREAIRWITPPALMLLPSAVRTTAHDQNAHEFQIYQCLPAAAAPSLAPITVIHLHNRASTRNPLTEPTKKRIVRWLLGTPPPWVVGGDLNIGRWLFEHTEGGTVGVISDSGNQRNHDVLFHSPDLPLQSLRCCVGRYWSTAGVTSISDAHNVVAAEALLPSAHLRPPPVVAEAADARPTTPATPPEGLALTVHIPVTAAPLDHLSEAAAADTRPSRLTVPELPLTNTPSGVDSSEDPFAADTRMETAGAPMDPTPTALSIPEVPSSTATAPLGLEATSPAAAAREDIPVAALAASSSVDTTPSLTTLPPPTAADARGYIDSEAAADARMDPTPTPSALPPPHFLAAAARLAQDVSMDREVPTDQVPTAPSAKALSRPTAADTRMDTTPGTGTHPPHPMAAVARPDGGLPTEEEADADMDPFRASLLDGDPSRQLNPAALLALLPRPPRYSFRDLAWAYGFDGQEYTWEQFVSFHGDAHVTAPWTFACRVTHDVHRATISVTFFRERLQTVTDIAPAAAELLTILDQFLIDPRLPPVDMPHRVRQMLLQPLWVRRAALETGGYADTIRMPEALCATTWMEWQKWWLDTALLPHQRRKNAKEKRGYWFAHVKNTCGNPVWVKTLLKHGIQYMDALLLALLATRATLPGGSQSRYSAVDARYEGFLRSSSSGGFVPPSSGV